MHSSIKECLGIKKSLKENDNLAILSFGVEMYVHSGSRTKETHIIFGKSLENDNYFMVNHENETM